MSKPFTTKQQVHFPFGVQIEKQVKEMVEDTLLQQGLDAYRYVEGFVDEDGKKLQSGKHKQ